MYLPSFLVNLRWSNSIKYSSCSPESSRARKRRISANASSRLELVRGFHNPVFSSDKRLVFYCAGGGRSALATSTAQMMGVEKVLHIGGGFKAWKEAGGPVVAADKA